MMASYRDKNGNITRYRCDNTKNGPVLTGLTSDESAHMAKMKAADRRQKLNYSEDFECEMSARLYLRARGFRESGGIWRHDRHYASLHKLKSGEWMASYWFEHEHILPVEPPARYRKPPHELARLPGWVT